MKKLLLLLIFFSSPMFAQNTNNLDKLFMQGNSFYQGKQYNKAIEKYKEILVLNINSFKVNYNMGCSYFRLNDFANSRLYFEKAKKLQPESKKTINNLLILKSKLKDKVENPKIGLIERIGNMTTGFLSYNVLTMLLILSIIFFSLTCALIFSKRFENKPLYYSLVVSFVILIFIFSVYNSKKNILNKNEAIVFQSEVEIFSEPSTGSAILFKLHSGTKISIEDTQSGFYHISLPNGMNGWADLRSFNKI